MTASEVLEGLRDMVAPEANHLLTEPSGPPKPPGDFGWFCREHAVITSILCHTFDHPVQIVRGDVHVYNPPHFTLSCTGEHWWCTGAVSEILDLSLKLDYLDSSLMTSHAVVGIGSNGPFTVIVSSTQSTENLHNGSPYIIYTPIETLPFSAMDLAADPTCLVPSIEAAHITARCCLHILALLRGDGVSYIGKMTQGAALADLRRRFPNAIEIIKTIT